MKNLIHSSLMVTIVRVFGIGLQSIIIIFLARELPIEEMGVFAFCYAILGLARMLGPLGTDIVTMRRIASAKNKFAKDLHISLNSSFVLVCCVTFSVSLICIVGEFWVSTPLSSESIYGYSGVLWATISIPAFAITGLLTLQLRGFDYNVLAQIPDSIGLQILFGAGIIYAQSTGQLNIDTTLSLLAIAAWAAAVTYIAIRIWIGVELTATPTFDAMRALIGESKDTLYALSVTALSVRAPIFFAAALLGPAMVSILDIAIRFGTLPSITTSAVTSTFSPRFAIYLETQDRANLSKALSLASILAAVPALLCFILIASSPLYYGIETILPPEYANTYIPMLLICGASLINALFSPASSVLFMDSKGSVVGNFSLAQLILLCIMALVLADSMGIIGLAVAVCAGTFIRDAGLAFWVSRKMNLHFPPLAIFRKNKKKIREDI
ncbi:MAG: lipopolysaccharide biosynthesis protein [Oceanospirillales bacterium]|nr:lipopolysaccharide biosynthesis protein [Oceanospirillales bacterium]